MKQSIVFLVIVFAVAFLATGCVPVYYAGESAQMWEQSESEADPVPEPVVEAAVSEPVQEEEPVDQTEYAVDYQMGDVGPAGGLIVIDMGDTTLGWRYMEMAPAQTGVASATWVPAGFYDEIGETSTALGSGMDNTRQIISKVGTNPSQDYAALMCDRLEFGGYRDWFLPSREALLLIEENLETEEYWDLLHQWSNISLWSSSEAGKPGAWYVQFPGGMTSDANKFYPTSVRAVRTF
jgi:hypothetical protein